MGFLDKVDFKNARAMVFSKSDGVDKSFWSGLENLDFLMGVALVHIYLPEKLIWGGLTLPETWETRQSWDHGWMVLFIHPQLSPHD